VRTRKLLVAVLLIAMVTTTLAACGATPEPQIVEKVVTKEVEKVVTQEVEKVVTQEVEKVVTQVVKETVIVEGTPQIVEKEVVVTATPEAAQQACPNPGGTVVVAWSAQPDGLFPDYVSTATASYANAVIYNSLVRPDPTGKVVGDLAESWDLSDDFLTWTFKLRQGVKWQDGEPFTAQDVKFSYEFPADPEYLGSAYSNLAVLKGAQAKHDGQATEVEGVVVIDDYTISFTTEEPNALFLDTVAQRPIFPSHLLKDIPVAELGESDQMRQPIGTGPYIMVDWKADESLTFQAFDDYFGNRACIDTYIWKVMPEMPTQVTELLAGGVDAVLTISADDFPTVQSNPAFQTVQVPGVAMTTSHFNFRKPFFQDKRTRQALEYAVDKEAMLQALANGLGTIITSPIHPSLPEYDPNLTGYPYDPDKAKELLDEVGWRDEDGDGVLEAHGVAGVEDGTPFQFKMGTLTIRRYEPQTLIIQEYWKEIGVETEVEEVDFNLYWSEYMTADNPDWWAGGSGWFNLLFHPQTELEWNYLSTGSNTVIDGFGYPELDDLILKAPTVFDPDQRRDVYWQIQQIIEDEVPIPLWTRDDTLAAFSNNLVLPEFGSLNDMFTSIPEWYWSK
jgi:peptide/nickel transport system substrate-binding protein